MAEAYLLNPFLGNINPGPLEGAKLYNKATATIEDKITIPQKNAHDIQTHFETDSSNFGWGLLVGNVITRNAQDPETKSIFTHSKDLTIELVQRHARTTWGSITDPWDSALPQDIIVRDINPAQNAAQRGHFYRRTRSLMIAKRIEASLDKASLKSLMLEKKKF